MKRRILEVEVDFLSLVPRGANQLRTIYKSDTGRFEIETLTKLDEGQGVLYAIAYAPEFRDSQGDIASVDVCKQMAYSFAANGANLDLRHDGKAITKDRAFVAETFIVQPDDPRFVGLTASNGASVDPTGGWGVAIKLEDPELRKWYASGAWGGVSLGGRAHVVETNKEGVFDMDAKELLATLEKNNEALVTAIAKALTPPEPKKGEPQPEAVKKTDPLAFEGDPLDPEAVASHLKKIRAAQLLTEIDWTNPEAVAKYHESIKKDAPKVSDQEKALLKQLADLRKAAGQSNQKKTADAAPQTYAMGGLSKEEATAWKEGVAFAAEIRKEYESATA